MTNPGNNTEEQPAQDGVIAGERYGDYEVIKPLASGGMADIFLARKLGVEGFQKLVVVKRIRRELVKDDHLIDMFIDEAHVAAKLDHPNVVVVSDLGEIEDSYFMAMEYLRGQTLRTLQKKIVDLNKMLPPAFWCRIMEYALDGLHYAHELRGDNGALMNLVHRDFTPSNIMITYSGTVKVIDFGVAHVEAPTRHETRVGTIKGKISYLAPEQCMAQPLYRRADVFAAGIVLWELLSRRRLFDGPSDAAIIVAIIKDEVPLPGWAGQPLDQDLQYIVMKALERDPARRFQSAAEMRDALRQYLRNQQHKLDASDIAEVMNALFDQERVEDERISRDPSKSNPLPRPREGQSRSGTSRSGASSRSGSGSRESSVSRTAGSARGQQIPQPQPAPRRGAMLAVGGGVAALLLGAGVWKLTRPAPTPPPAAQPVAQPAPPPPVAQPTPPKPEPPVAPPKADPPPPPTTTTVAEKEKEKQPKSTAPSSGFGFLDFDTRPYTSVYIGKKKLGDTPMLDVKVPAGNLTLTLVNDDAGIHETFTVTVPKGGHVFKKLKL